MLVFLRALRVLRGAMLKLKKYWNESHSPLQIFFGKAVVRLLERE